MKKTTVKSLIIAAGTLALFGCEQKLTYNRFQAIHEGDPSDAVELTLGKPSQKTDLSWIYSDADRQIMATIFIQDNKVTGKEWHDAEHGMVGKSPYVNQPGDSHEVHMRETK